MKPRISVITLILANLSPLFGALFLNWNISSILFLYWFENVIIGFFNFLKMQKAQNAAMHNSTMNLESFSLPFKKEAGLSYFFLMHYGMFTFVHGFIIFSMIYKDLALDMALYIGIVSLFISHGISYYSNFLGKKEYENATQEALMLSPYKRVVIMHMVVLIGGAIIFNLKGSSLGLLLVLILFKLSIDLISHIHEHKKLSP